MISAIIDTVSYCVKRLDHQSGPAFLHISIVKGRMLLQEKWKDFMDKMGLDDFSDPMDELPEEVMMYRWENE